MSDRPGKPGNSAAGRVSAIRWFWDGFVRYHRGLGRLPGRLKPFLASLLIANMIAPLFGLWQVEARVVLAVAILNGIIFVLLTARFGFTRILGLGHVLWIPLILYLTTRLDVHAATSVHGIWIRVVILINSISLVFDTWNVIQYLGGKREELVSGL